MTENIGSSSSPAMTHLLDTTKAFSRAGRLVDSDLEQKFLFQNPGSCGNVCTLCANLCAESLSTQTMHCWHVTYLVLCQTLFGYHSLGAIPTFPHLATSDAELGIVNVVTQYGADPSGKRDSTSALQSAIDYARQNRLTVFVPLGTYIITESLNCSEHNSGRFKPVVIVGEKRSVPQAAGSVQRPEFYLPPKSPGFTNVKWPRYVVHFMEDDSLPNSNSSEAESDRTGKKKTGDYRANVNFNQVLQGVNIRIGDGNHGAIGIRLRGAQGSSIEDCTIDLGLHGFIGAEGASGSGGSHKGLTVIGGRYGLDFRFAQPAPTVTGVHLINQTCAALLYAGHETLTAVGVHIESYVAHDDSAALLGHIASVPAEVGDNKMPWLPNSGPCSIPKLWPIIQPPSPIISGHMSIIDSLVETNQPNKAAISTARGLYVRNVWVQGSKYLFQLQRGNLTGPRDYINNPSSANEWTHISEAAYSIQPPFVTVKLPDGKPVGLQYQAVVWKDGEISNQNLSRIEEKALPPPDELTLQHMYDELSFPSFQSPEAVSVTMPPYNAVGNGSHDDTAAIQNAINNNEIVVLPKGYYLVTSTLKFRQNTKFVGVGRSFTLLVIPKEGLAGDGADINPIIETPAGEGSVVVAYLTVTSWHNISNTYAINWQTYGPGCLYRQGFFFTSYYTPDPSKIYLADPDLWPAGAPMPNVSVMTSHPLIVISGGGKFYDLENEDCIGESPSYRHLLVKNSSRGLNFYQLNMEHGRGDANTEIDGSSNVQIFGLKSEGNFVVLWLRNSANVSLYGYGGNAASFPLTQKYPPGYVQTTPSLFRVDSCHNLRLCNLRDIPRVAGGNQTFFAGQGFDPHDWSMVYDVSANIHTPPMIRPVLYYTS